MHGLRIENPVLRIGRTAVLLVAFCIGSGAQSSKMIKVDDSFNGREVALQTGDALEVAIAENATTGFRWFVKTKLDFLPEFQESEPPPSSPPGPPGKGGVHRFYFRAAHAGTGELELEYRRSWEKQKAPARLYKLRVRVSG
jgi:inhibitor of cysteine peptidase